MLNKTRTYLWTNFAGMVLNIALNLCLVPKWGAVGAAVSALAVATHDGGGLASTLDGQPLAGVPFLLLVGIGVYAAITALTVVPRLAQLGAANGRRR